MKKYKVGIFEEQGGYICIEAKSPKDAEKKALEYLDEYGFGGDTYLDKYKIETTHRETSIVDSATLIKE